MKSFKEKLKELGACPEAVEWVGDRTEQEAWEECERADWMLWYVFCAKIGTKRDRILAVCACARTTLKYVPEGEDRPRLAIEAAERYAKKPTEENMEKVKEATEAALDVAKEENGPAASEAARSAAWAAKAARVAYFAFETADWAAYFAAGVAGATDKAAHREMCRIIREKIKLKGGQIIHEII